jgi:nitrogenase molybdenum-iron protein alpha/beta subunit
VYHINYILGRRGDRPSEIFTTCLDEHDVVFGAEQKLKEAIEDLDRTLSPDMMFVLSCCASCIIGEDVGSAVRETKTSSRVLAISAGGFEGDFRDGYSETLRQLVEELVLKSNIVHSRSVNLIGMLRAGPDLTEIKRLLSLIDVKVNAVLTADARRGDIERLGDAALNIVLCEPAGKGAAELLQAICGTPYIIEEIPIGNRSTCQFLVRVAEKLGISCPADLLESPDKMPDYSFLKYRNIAIVSGPTRAVSMTRFLAEYDVVPRLIVVDFDSSVKEKIHPFVQSACEVLIEPDNKLIMEKLKEHKIDLLIGGMLEHPIAKLLGIEHFDIMHGGQKTVGFTGAINLLNLLCNKGQN